MGPAISLQAVSKTLNKRKLLDSVSFDVQPGDVFGYLGPNGAGKTTTIRVILGLLRPSAGTVRILGEDAVRSAGARRRVGFVLEADGLYDNLSARENLTYYSDIYGLARDPARLDSALGEVGLLDRAADRVAIYSKGMRQRLALARSVLHNPDVLILDEPTAGVDPTGQIETREIIQNYARLGKTVFLSSHNLDEVQRVCNRVAIIHKGEIRLCDEVKKLRQSGQRQLEVRLERPLPPEAEAALRQAPAISASRFEGGLLILTVAEGADTSAILSMLLQKGAAIAEVRPREVSLEDIYARIVGVGAHEETAE